MRKSTCSLIVNVRSGQPEDRLDPQDRDLAGDYGLTLTGRLAVRPDPEEAALDVFHQIIPIAQIDDFEITVRKRVGSEPVREELGPFSRVPAPEFADRLLHEAFGEALRRARPDAPAEALVYEVDAGEPEDANTRIEAAVFLRGIIDEDRMVGEPIRISVAKTWLAEVLNARGGPETPEP
ncbi:hypothetical protein IQ03_01113 [Gemmobacter caeni]|uniref:Uncharacterized protein n=1 Tax=Gemmobacter caeni TaxID=589035 RepID=A0A2T6B8D9_9RHOB|nr:hypothetical protein [Gemmobacter caeni]PTX52323.1 hypothetical protein C8N34_102102 [Gemmobacter caeni]TWJ02695.1 hypothetical protein IQ03_01113 [Gemmobacter caeni]